MCEKIMVTYDFPKPMYVKAIKNLSSNPELTSNKADAAIWGDMDTEQKLAYHKSILKLKGVEYIQHEKTNN